MLEKWKGVFSHGQFDLGCTGIAKNRIELDDSTPFRDRTRRIPPAMLEEVRQDLQEMLKLCVTQASQSPWSSNMVLVRKKNCGLRVCVDFRKLHAQTIRDSFSLPPIDETLDLFRLNSWFSNLDLRGGFWTKSIGSELLLLLVLLGYTILIDFHSASLTSFQRLMQKALEGLHLKICFFVDDIIVFTNSVEQHVERLE